MCVCVYLEGRAKALFSLRSCSPVWEGFTGLWHIAQWTQPSIWVHCLTFLTQVDLIQFTQQCHRYPVSPLLDSLLQYSCKLLIFYENNDFNGCLDCGNIHYTASNNKHFWPGLVVCRRRQWFKKITPLRYTPTSLLCVQNSILILFFGHWPLQEKNI